MKSPFCFQSSHAFPALSLCFSFIFLDVGTQTDFSPISPFWGKTTDSFISDHIQASKSLPPAFENHSLLCAQQPESDKLAHIAIFKYL